MPKALGLEYDDSGQGEAILLIHGSIAARANEPLWRQLAADGRYRVVTYHRRGLGGSDRHTGPFSIADQARDAAALLEHLGIQHAHVVGHSYGGIVTVELALDRPDLVRSLILIEPATAVALNPTARTGFSAAIDRMLERYNGGNSAAAINGFMTGAESPEWKSLFEAALPGSVAQAEFDAPAFFEIEYPALMEWSFDSASAARISQPVAYIIGGDARLERQRATLRGFAGLVPHAEEIVVPDASHGMTHQKPAETAAAVLGFLSRQLSAPGV